MPYITKETRQDLSGDLWVKTPGELNYLFTALANRYLAACGESYQSYNDILGALEGAKLELYRRKIAPYEDEKMKLNGDVF